MTFEIANRHPRLADPTVPARRILSSLANDPRFALRVDGEFSLAFVSDAEIGKIHGVFMDDPTPTDVITFPPDPEMEFAGEVIVSVDHALSRASEPGIGFSSELALYVVHGWLHLAGFDDTTDSGRAAMRAAEALALDALGEGLRDDPFHLD